MRATSVLVVAITLVLSQRAFANPLRSQLTTIDLSECRTVAAGPGSKAWLCPGLKGFPVLLTERDGRHTLSFGSKPAGRRSVTQSLAERNTIFDGKTRPTIEWRIEHRFDGGEVPFATIVRYHARRGEHTREVLVITKVDASRSCRLAVIDASATDNPMALARNWADAEARQRTCPAVVERIGAPADTAIWPD
ncbi:MAG: hypothetical protein AB7O43_14820 [Hyphomicrobiaceae bacterium]